MAFILLSIFIASPVFQAGMNYLATICQASTFIISKSLKNGLEQMKTETERTK